jgi:serine protease AprX
MSVLKGFQATMSPQLAAKLNHDPRVKHLNLNSPIKFLGTVDGSHLLSRYNGASRIPTAWSGGLDGTNIKVATIDTGAWPHDDLVTKSPYVPGNVGNRLVVLATNSKATDALDHFGHGTHVAGIIGGNGYGSGGQYIGVAPNSLLVSVKVADDLGNANEGDVISGLEWVYQANKRGMNIRVINLSLQSTVAQSYHQSALDAMVEKLWYSGVVVVASAGNSPNGSGPVLYAPGNDPYAITVGSIDDFYQSSLAGSQMASWALYGTTQDGFAKPEVVADGSHVVSLLAPASTLSVLHTGNIVGTSYFKMGGTSMASPQVAGMAALMLQNNPSLTNNKIKRMLRRNSRPFGTTAYTSWLGTGGGFLDESAVGTVDVDDNQGVPASQSFDLATNNILAGGIWWTGATWPASVSWNNIGWSNIGWSQVDFSNIGWSSSSNGTPIQTSNIGWSNIGWSNIGWSNIGWSNIGWSNIGWSNIGWSNIGWSDTTFN